MTVDVLIVGAGFAGAATAYHLSRHFRGSILLVDRESKPGLHASGRNARLVFQQVEDPEARALLVDSCRAYRRREELGYQPAGSLLLGDPARLSRLAGDPPESQLVDRARVADRVPMLASHPFSAALWTPSDGVMPIERLLHFYVDGARRQGVLLRLGVEARLEGCEPPFLVSLGPERVEAGVVVDAAGAWADDVAAGAGLPTAGLSALKRHLFVLEAAGTARPEAPFVWDLDLDFYLRPEGRGWLVSLCEELPDRATDDLSVEEGVVRQLHEFLDRHLPPLAGARLAESWSCFRTHAPGSCAHIGWAPGRSGFFWVAGLGGHGMGSSWAVGQRAARQLRERL